MKDLDLTFDSSFIAVQPLHELLMIFIRLLPIDLTAMLKKVGFDCMENLHALRLILFLTRRDKFFSHVQISYLI